LLKNIEAKFLTDKALIMKVRNAVFVEEQGVSAELELDDKDELCSHALILNDGDPIATGRIESDGHIGRIAVLKAFRQEGLGRRVVQQLEQTAMDLGLKRVYLGAQLTAIGFYEKLGYHCYGEIFMDAGIEHRHMEKILVRSNP